MHTSRHAQCGDAKDCADAMNSGCEKKPSGAQPCPDTFVVNNTVAFNGALLTMKASTAASDCVTTKQDPSNTVKTHETPFSRVKPTAAR